MSAVSALNPPPQRVPQQFLNDRETQDYFAKQLHPFLRLISQTLSAIDADGLVLQIAAIQAQIESLKQDTTMATTAKALVTNYSISATATADANTLLTAADLSQITKATVYNSHSSAVTVKFYLVSEEGTASTPIAAQSIPATSSAAISELNGHVIPKTSMLQAEAGTTSVISVNISGLEIT